MNCKLLFLLHELLSTVEDWPRWLQAVGYLSTKVQTRLYHDVVRAADGGPPRRPAMAPSF